MDVGVFRACVVALHQPAFTLICVLKPVLCRPPPSRVLTSFSPCTNGSELENSALADGGVGGQLLRIPTVARKQVMHAGTA